LFSACFDCQLVTFFIAIHNTGNQVFSGLQLVLTYNFATAITETTSHKLQTLTSTLQLVFSFQNCELKQEPRTLATELHQSHNFHNRERKFFFTFAGLGWNCAEIETSGRIFVLTLNRASALTVSDKKIDFLLPLHLIANHNRIGLESKLPSFDSIGQKINFLLPLHLVANHNRIGLESKQTACFDLQFCHYQHRNHIPQIANTYIHTTNGLQTSKL